MLGQHRKGKDNTTKRVDVKPTYQIVKFHSCDALVDTRDNFLRDCSSINVFWVKSITQSGDASCDLVELDTLFASICGEYKLMRPEEVQMILLTALVDIHDCRTL